MHNIKEITKLFVSINAKYFPEIPIEEIEESWEDSSVETNNRMKKVITETCSKYADIKSKEVIIEFTNWLTREDSPYVIMYGGTPELEKDYRFAGEHDDFTIEEVFEDFKKFKKNDNKVKENKL